MANERAFENLWHRHEDLTQRFAQLLHDDAGQLLTAIALRLSALDVSPETREELTGLEQALDELLDRFRTAQASLGAAVVKKRGLIAAVSQLSRHLGTLRFEGDSNPAWPLETAQAAFRVIESLAPTRVVIKPEEVLLETTAAPGPYEEAFASAGNLKLHSGPKANTIRITHAHSSPRR